MWWLALSLALADPCGMVMPPPPPHLESEGGEAMLKRDGTQRTWVAYEDGVQTMVLRPGFRGSVDAFGMLIPFPSAPTLRKVDEDVFSQVEAAIDPPAMEVDVVYPVCRSFWPPIQGNPSSVMGGSSGVSRGGGSPPATPEPELGYYEVKLVRKEAVGMYQAAVLQAGSPEALERWMAQNGFAYPDGMEEAVSAYVEARWFFVAIKARVGGSDAAKPHPGMRTTRTERPEGTTFDGFVQAMGFRFETPQAVLPMRLSVHNATDAPPRNVVYMLTDQPVAITDLDPDLVVRQVAGDELLRHLEDPIPLWFRSGRRQDVSPLVFRQFAEQRQPDRFNGVARELIASDLVALSSDDLELDYERAQTELLNISESLGLRGSLIDARHAEVVGPIRDEILDHAVYRLAEMTLTVLDGHFDVEILARQNLGFEAYDLPDAHNMVRLDPIKPRGPRVSVPAMMGCR